MVNSVTKVFTHHDDISRVFITVSLAVVGMLGITSLSSIDDLGGENVER
jgi:hypothetical protein